MLNNLDLKHGGGSSSSIAKDPEQVEVYEYNKYAGMGLTHEEADFFENFSTEQRKALIRKVDLRLVPVLALLYLFSHIDRANIGNAKIEVPSNVLLKKFKRPSTYIGILVVSWGTIMTMTGLVKNFAGLMTRLALFYCASALSGACSGLLAFAISKMDGLGGRPGWAWIFLLEYVFPMAEVVS
ncbi:unnamed protein product [Aureobasidium vineae]|uniref:Uncharacterized protein n=1 Tax=Aureobasidium vineae TaxID=2773715 RepID=A0A9N8P7H1_9PEZI|nr:unnamed protein product [Aureobasidium vineae]